MKRRILSLLMAIAMLLSMVPTTVFAADTGENSEITSGTCGENVTWAFDEATGTLTISGTGKMADFFNLETIPWYDYSDQIKTVTIQNGVTSIGEFAFYNCTGVTHAEIPASVTIIGGAAFFDCDALTSITIPGSVTKIRAAAFSGCGNLGNITLGNGVLTIGDGAFTGCAMTEITIPASVTGIGNTAFSSCENLVSATFLGDALSSVGENMFANTAENFTICYYEGTEGWTNPWNGYPTEGVTVPATGVTLDRTSATTVLGGTFQLTAQVVPENATNQNIVWSSGNQTVATVDETGVVTGIGAGSTTITAKTEDGAYTASCTVSVTEPQYGLVVDNIDESSTSYYYKPYIRLFVADNQLKIYTVASIDGYTVYQYINLGNNLPAAGDLVGYVVDGTDVHLTTTESVSLTLTYDAASGAWTDEDGSSVTMPDTVFIVDADDATNSSNWIAGSTKLQSGTYTVDLFGAKAAKVYAAQGVSGSESSIILVANPKAAYIYDAATGSYTYTVGLIAPFGETADTLTYKSYAPIAAAFEAGKAYHVTLDADEFLYSFEEVSLTEAAVESTYTAGTTGTRYFTTRTGAFAITDNAKVYVVSGYGTSAIKAEDYYAMFGGILSDKDSTAHYIANAAGDVNYVVFDLTDTSSAEEVITPAVNVTTASGTPVATVTAPEGGWVAGENTFAVTSEKVCYVAISYDGGITYTRLEATANADGSCSFTAELTADAIVEVAVAGDVNGDGKITNADVTRTKAAYQNKVGLSALAGIVADVNGSGSLTNADVTRLKAVYQNKTTLSW